MKILKKNLKGKEIEVILDDDIYNKYKDSIIVNKSSRARTDREYTLYIREGENKKSSLLSVIVGSRRGYKVCYKNGNPLDVRKENLELRKSGVGYNKTEAIKTCADCKFHSCQMTCFTGSLGICKGAVCTLDNKIRYCYQRKCLKFEKCKEL